MMDLQIGKKGSIHAVYNDGGDCLYITENDTTAEMVALEGYIVAELPFYGAATGGLASAMWRDGEIVAAVNLKEIILHHSIALDATGTTLIMIK